MNHLKMCVTGKQLSLEANNQTVKTAWPPSDEKIDGLIKPLLKAGQPVSAIEGLLPQASIEGLNGVFKQFGKQLSEALNCPIVYLSGENSIGEWVEASDSWNLDYYGYQPGKDEYAVESLLTVGNGFLGLRGTTPEMKISESHYPATYLAGLYNEVVSLVAEKEISNEDFVNAPNLQYLTIAVDGEKITFAKEQILELERHLDLKTGRFSSQAIVQTSGGKELKLTVKKIVSMANRNQYAISYKVKPLNFSGEIQVIAEAEGDVFNYNVERYRSLNSHHLAVDEVKAEENRARLVAHTTASDLGIVQESKLLSDCNLSWTNKIVEKKAVQEALVSVEKGEPITVEKLVFVERLPSGADTAQVSGMDALTSFDELYAKSCAQWDELWNQVNIEIEGDMMSEKMLHLHTYHLLVSASPYTINGLDVSVTARGLHGEAYRGHIFWDELYIFPFYIMHFPKAAKELFLYRYHRLDAAKEAAKAAGYEGAMFPWQSGLDGSEQSQEVHLNPMSGNWDEDHSRLQRHVSLAIAYNIWLYYENTKDIPFMDACGLEILVEITKFWISITKYDNDLGRYSIDGVMGPDEFHEAYPGAKHGGIRDNAYTNMMVAWLFGKVQELLAALPAKTVNNIKKKTGLTAELEEKVKQIKQQLYLEIDQEGVIAQFAGYFDLEEVDWEYYRNKYEDVQRMDRILKAEGHSPDGYQVAKQADSLMIFYNFEKGQIDRLLADLGYQVPKDYFEKNLDYYLKRTSHGSTLSRVVHTKLADMAGDKGFSWQLYQESLFSDYQDIQGGTTAEGIHTGVMASTIYITLNTYGGIDIRQPLLTLNPSLPEQWKKMQFQLLKNGVHYQITILPTQIVITADQDISVVVAEKKIALHANCDTTIEY